MRLKIIGDAGTGKTSRIVKIAARFDAVVLSHTRAAAAAVRASARRQELPVNVSTLHAYACREVPELRPFLKKTRELGGVENIRQEFARRHGLSGEEAEAFFSFYSYLVNTGYHRGEVNVDEALRRVRRGPYTASVKPKLVEEYELFKVRRGLVDYEDMLKFLYDAVEKALELPVVVIDEAQDNSPLQWAILKAAKLVFASGDELQSIYSFQGARPKLFQRFGDRFIILDRNYRIPSKIWDFAGKIVRKQLRRRRAEAVKKGGLVKAVERPVRARDVVELVKREWDGKKTLVMARYNKFVEELYLRLKAEGLPVCTPNNYYDGQIVVGTIHSCKGYEGENAILVDAIDEHEEEDEEEEERVWYVGATRAREKLVIAPLLGWEHFLSSLFGDCVPVCVA